MTVDETMLAVADERERCIAICDGWLHRFEGSEIKYTSPQEYAADAVKDIRDLILKCHDPRKAR